jgi:hypothetical protein
MADVLDHSQLKWLAKKGKKLRYVSHDITVVKILTKISCCN